ncbi:MAG: nicotinate phosphoribosyltransferase [Alphaproteobacteria bacterium]|nr:nicotinate phosphoribosyltransferase [Alphaproteobacteria bacterium]
MISATHIDLYQLTSLVPHFDAGMADTPVAMSFFSRRLPRRWSDGQPARGFLLWVGLRRCLEWLSEARFDEAHLRSLLDHPTLGPALAARPELLEALRRWRFEGRIHAPPEGSVLLAGRACHAESGEPLDIDGVRPTAMPPYVLVECDLLTAKLIETPLLSIINHMTMVGSKAARIVLAAGEKGVLEFGQRRTHPQAAVDAAYAAWVAGVAGTSNVEAWHRYGVPVSGTMDHFAVQAWERPGVPRHETETAFFRAFYEAYPQSSFLLVDTYDTFGEQTGIRAAVKATEGKLSGVRLDSNLSVETVRRARALLDALGAPQARIAVSGGLDEDAIAELAEAPVDLWGIGERMVTSPDAPVGVGAVGKLCVIGGQPTMKLSRGSAKATLPGLVQAWRQGGVDTLGLRDEGLPGQPLLQPVWEGTEALPQPTLAETRAYAKAQLVGLSEEQRAPRQPLVPVSAGLAGLITQIVRRA